MSELINIGSNPDNEKLLSAVSGFKVPASNISKDEMWDKLILGVDKVEKYNRLRLRLMKWSAAAIVLIAVTSGILEWKYATKTIEAPAGSLAYGYLPDSSMVTLNAGSKIKYKEYSFNSDRTVKLSGEAYFDVSKGGSDFVVVAGKNTVRVVGTEFNAYYRSGQFSVECLSGTIEVASNSTFRKKISAGKGVVITSETSPLVFDVDLQQAASWVRGEHFYSNAPLGLVFQELERQFNIRIKPQGFDPNQRFYSGYFTTQNLKHALELVCLPMGLTFEINQKTGAVKIIQQ